MQMLPTSPHSCINISTFKGIIRVYIYILVSWGWGETESTWYVDHCLAYCASPGREMMSVE
jgi:hypothetical protein